MYTALIRSPVTPDDTSAIGFVSKEVDPVGHVCVDNAALGVLRTGIRLRGDDIKSVPYSPIAVIPAQAHCCSGINMLTSVEGVAGTDLKGYTLFAT